jgi:hypothetical protein
VSISEGVSDEIRLHADAPVVLPRFMGLKKRRDNPDSGCTGFGCARMEDASPRRKRKYGHFGGATTQTYHTSSLNSSSMTIVESQNA